MDQNHGAGSSRQTQAALGAVWPVHFVDIVTSIFLTDEALKDTKEEKDGWYT
jgi:hypothetical protein